MPTNTKKYRVVDVQGVTHEIEAAAVVEDTAANRISFYADKDKTEPVGSFVGASGFSPVGSVVDG
jgi:hypothetical protein